MRTIYKDCHHCDGSGAWNNPDNKCPHCDGRGYFTKETRCSNERVKKNYPGWTLYGHPMFCETHQMWFQAMTLGKEVVYL